MPSYLVAPLGVSRQAAYTYISKTVLHPGSVVRLPFGKTARLGVVLETTTPFPSAKALTSLKFSLTNAQLDLARWISQIYFAPIGLSLKMFLPKEVPRYLPEQINTRPTPLSPHPPVPVLNLQANRQPYYEKSIKKAKKTGQSVLITVPELTLTTGLFDRLKEHYGDIVLWHSQLSPKKRALAWWRVRSGRPVTVLGSRSALFLPWQNLGVVIIDEEDDLSYKQEQTPTYQTRAVAAKLAELAGASLIYGSVSPSLETYLKARTTVSPQASSSPEVTVVDPARNRDRDSLLAYELWRFLGEALDQQKQGLLYAPKRYQLPLIQEIRRGFPSAAVAHFAPEEMNTAQIDGVLEDFRAKKTTLLIGGHPLTQDWLLQPDFIGAVGLDTLLQLPDFRATEKAQALARKLLSKLSPSSRLIVQSTIPEHPVWQALTEDFTRFAKAELKERQALRLPPYVRIARVLFPTKASGERFIAAWPARPEERLSLQELPRRSGSQYRYSLILREPFTKTFSLLSQEARLDIDPSVFP